MIRTLRMVVQSWHCDHVGHLNAGLYMQWLGDAAFSLFAEHGLDGEGTRRHGVNMAAVRAEIDFKREGRWLLWLALAVPAIGMLLAVVLPALFPDQ